MQIQIADVVKEYATVRAVDEVSFAVSGAEILALLGPNGAGKSSLVRMLVGLTQPDSGTIEIIHQGQTFQVLPQDVFGYLPEDRGLYQDRTLRQLLTYLGELRNLPRQYLQQRIDYWLERFELTARADENLKQLSKGNQQKVQLISTLLHEPAIVILDEPFSGLDPVNQEVVLNVLRELRDQGVTVLLSAHQMELVERLADRMVLMNQGAVVAAGTLNDIRDQLRTHEELIFTFAEPVTGDLFSNLNIPDVQQSSPTCWHAKVSERGQIPGLLAKLTQQAPLLEAKRQQQALHELYLTAVKEQKTGQGGEV